MKPSDWTPVIITLVGYLVIVATGLVKMGQKVALNTERLTSEIADRVALEAKMAKLEDSVRTILEKVDQNSRHELELMRNEVKETTKALATVAEKMGGLSTAVEMLRQQGNK